MIRQTQSDKWINLKNMSFWEFLYEAGMFEDNKCFKSYLKEEKRNAKLRYLNALSAAVQGSAMVVLKRKVKDVFINAFNKKIMRLFKANHDIQICIDHYAAAQYICGYLTKNESGISKLLKAVNEETTHLKQIDKLNALASILDKHREVSIQEAIYRLLGLQMTKSSVKVKYLSTVHPHFRDGLLKGKLDELDDQESIFHKSAHQYYELRPETCENQDKIYYDAEELVKDYWKNLCLAEFWSKYEIVYGTKDKVNRKEKTKLIPLKNKAGFIRKRSEKAVLRYYLNYSNDEDLARGLLILFMPFRDEMKEIHMKDVKQLLQDSSRIVEEKRSIFEKYKPMSDLINTIEADNQETEYKNDDEDDESNEIETTTIDEISEFNNWAKSQASKDLSKYKNLINACDINHLRLNISSLNFQQRRLFDDFTERCASFDVNEKPVYLFISGNAGTGKSFLVSLLIEAVKVIKVKAGDDLKKPPVIVMAPTANAAFIIGGKTIDSVLGFLPLDSDQYTQARPSKMAMMKFEFEDVYAIFCDEISMVGSKKLLKINYRLQDLVDQSRSKEYMGGISFIASGDLWQLPPIMDRMVTENNTLDSRPECAPSHWDINFKIFYLTEKMRSQKDPQFSEVCDRVGRGTITESDEKYLKSRVQSTDSENCNDNFKNGKISIIVTTNPKKDLINHQKLEKLLPNQPMYSCNSTDRVTNLPVGNKLPEKLKDNPGRTGNLQSELKLKIGAPVMVTSNHSNQKYREDGIVNGARGFVQAIQVSKDNPEKVDVVWVVFNNESIGRLYRFDHGHLRQSFNPGHAMATPILPSRNKFKLKFGNVEYQRQNFALSLAYSITAHKCQGQTLDEVIIDFGPDQENNIQNYICCGSFYVALTRVREGSKVFLKSFDRSYIMVNKRIEETIDAMIKFRSYVFKKIYLDEKIFRLDNSEIKVGYLNINGLQDGNHDIYFNCDQNLNNLDLIVLSETKLNAKYDTNMIEKSLNNWSIIARYDSEDQMKHMGLLLLKSKKSKFSGKISITYQTAKREDKLQIEGLIVNAREDLILGFVYCRSTPNESEIKAMNKYFGMCNVLMGDFNLSHRIARDQAKIVTLCQSKKVSCLKEITRALSNNQLDYIIMDEDLSQISFVTSYNNFISDHKSIAARIGLNGNSFTDEFKIRLTFDSECHQKQKINQENEDSTDESEISIQEKSFDSNSTAEACLNQGFFQSPASGEKSLHPIRSSESLVERFVRRFQNNDGQTCWLNSCLQFLLAAVDNFDDLSVLNSELGSELLQLKMNQEDKTLDSTVVKTIIVAAEDTRIALRLSELEADLKNLDELKRQSNAVKKLRLDLLTGQQCIRDFFLCLQANAASWPDVCTPFYFKLTHVSTCCECGNEIRSETNQICIEMDVPPDGSALNEFVETFFNDGELKQRFCEHCQRRVQSQNCSKLTQSLETDFLIIILTRLAKSLHNTNIATNDVLIR